MQNIRTTSILILILLTSSFASLNAVHAQGGGSISDSILISSGRIESTFSRGVEYYKVDVLSGQSVSISLNVPRGSDLNLHIYDPDSTNTHLNLIDSSESGASGVDEKLEIVSNQSGSYFIKISGVRFSGSGLYQMTVLVTEFEVLFSGWGSQASPVEVAPGDLGSPLNVVIRNGADFDITDLSVAIELSQFLSNSTRGKSLSATSSAPILAGGILSFTFLVNIDDDSPLEKQSMNMSVEYKMSSGTIIGEPLTLEIQVPITGRSFISLVSDTQVLSPSVTNDVTLKIKNEGTAETGTIDLVLNIQSPLSLLGSDNKWSLTSLAPEEETSIATSIFVPSSARGQTFQITGSMSFRNTFGVIQTETRTISLTVEKVTLDDWQLPRGSIVAVDSFWGPLGAETPVGPGDKRVKLSVTIQNLDVGTVSGVREVMHLSPPFTNITGGTSISGFFGSIIPVGGTATIAFLLNIDDDAQIGTYPIRMTVSYLDKDSLSRKVGLTFPVTIGGKGEIEVSLLSNILVAGTGNDVVIEVSNTGSAAIYSIKASLSFEGTVGQGQQNSPISIIAGDDERRIDYISSKRRAVLSFPTYVSPHASEGLHQAQVLISYRNPNGDSNTRSTDLGLVVKQWVSPLSIEIDDNRLLAGLVTSPNLRLNNIGDESISSIVMDLEFPIIQGSSPLSLASGSTSWTFNTLDPGDNTLITPSIFASLGGTDESYSIKMHISYLDSKGFPHAEVKEMGFSVRGRILLQLQDIQLTSVNVPAGANGTVIGTILNRGNTEALFLEARIIPDRLVNTGRGSLQYIGEIDPDTPVPFSLNFQVDGSVPDGEIQAVIEFIFDDAYGNTYSEIQEFTVLVGGVIPILQLDDDSSNNSILPFALPPQLNIINSSLGLLSLISIVVIIILVFVVRRRRKKSPF